MQCCFNLLFKTYIHTLMWMSVKISLGEWWMAYRWWVLICWPQHNKTRRDRHSSSKSSWSCLCMWVKTFFLFIYFPKIVIPFSRRHFEHEQKLEVRSLFHLLNSFFLFFFFCSLDGSASWSFVRSSIFFSFLKLARWMQNSRRNPIQRAGILFN